MAIIGLCMYSNKSFSTIKSVESSTLHLRYSVGVNIARFHSHYREQSAGQPRVRFPVSEVFFDQLEAFFGGQKLSFVSGRCAMRMPKFRLFLGYCYAANIAN